jgi:tetratricopeptide (TPR) repeat protein
MVNITISLMVAVIAAGLVQDPSSFDRARIAIVDTGKPIPYERTAVDAGPAEGNMLNAHYFPGMNFYNAGRYSDAEREMTYVINRPHYLDANPKRPEFVGMAYYLRGMIFLYHAHGVGRLTLAKRDFEAALSWNPNNYVPYLELARVYSELGFADEARKVLQLLLGLGPDETLASEARKELSAITQTVLHDADNDPARQP